MRSLLSVIIAGNLAGTSCSREEKILDVNIKITNAQGIADTEPRVMVSDESRPLAGIVVYQVAGNNDSYLTVAVDPSGNHFPERIELDENSSGLGLKRSALIEEINIVLETVKAFNYAREDAKKQQQFFMGETKNVNKYCVSLEQMIESNIVVPLGILGVVSEEIKIRALKPLSWLFEQYVITHFGKQEGYEVWVPKTVINLCGENYSEAVCTINRELLSEKLWMHNTVPVWEIIGPCDLAARTNENYQPTMDSRNTESNSNPTSPENNRAGTSASNQPSDPFATCYRDNDCDAGKSCQVACITKHDNVIYTSPRFSCENTNNRCITSSGGIAECRNICR